MLYTFMLNVSKRELDNALKHKDGYILTYRLISFLNISYSIREKFQTRENNDIILGLKKFYNITKHDYNALDIIESLTIPIGIEVEHPRFMDISNIRCLSKKECYSIKQFKKYNEFVKNKPIKEVSDLLYTDTMKILENNKYL